jgi:hypothetical protein
MKIERQSPRCTPRKNNGHFYMTPISLTACFRLMLSLALRTNPIENSDATRRLNRENNVIGCELFLDKVEMKANWTFTCDL